ncbi:MAG: hypothetical protein LBS11_11605 [Oscillospiraceae bacterium]|jgi:hypothetical protein|nr:hypothetical protein [Oscillospiraceae bacterium]
MSYALWVNTDALQQTAAHARNAARAMSDAQGRLARIASSLPNLGNLYINLNGRLRFASTRGGSAAGAIWSVASAFATVGNVANRFSSATLQAAQTFRQYEDELADNRLKTAPSAGGAGAGAWAGSIIDEAAAGSADPLDASKKEPSWWQTFLLKFGEKAGVISSGLAPLWAALLLNSSGEWLDGSAIGLAKILKGDLKAGEALVKILGEDMKKLAGNHDIMPEAKWWNKLFGLDDFFEGAATRGIAGLGENTSFALNKKITELNLFPTDAVTGAKQGFSASAALKWGGIAVSGIISGFENWDEFKDQGGWGNARFYAETVGETAVSWVTDTLIAVGAAAAIGAVFGAAPVIAVAAATVGVSMFLDWASEKLTDKKLSELISDTVIDGAVAAYEHATNAVTAFGNAFSKGWNALWGNPEPAFAGGGGSR